MRPRSDVRVPVTRRMGLPNLLLLLPGMCCKQTSSLNFKVRQTACYPHIRLLNTADSMSSHVAMMPSYDHASVNDWSLTCAGGMRLRDWESKQDEDSE